MHPKDAEGMANSVEPLTLIRLLRDYTVCPDTKDHSSKKVIWNYLSRENLSAGVLLPGKTQTGLLSYID